MTLNSMSMRVCQSTGENNGRVSRVNSGILDKRRNLAVIINSVYHRFVCDIRSIKCVGYPIKPSSIKINKLSILCKSNDTFNIKCTNTIVNPYVLRIRRNRERGSTDSRRTSRVTQGISLSRLARAEIYTHTHTYIYIYIYAHVYTYLCTRLYTCTYACIQTYITSTLRGIGIRENVKSNRQLIYLVNLIFVIAQHFN